MDQEANINTTIKGLFVDEISWKDPRFSPWNIENLGELNDAQLDGLMEDDVNTILYSFFFSRCFI